MLMLNGAGVSDVWHTGTGAEYRELLEEFALKCQTYVDVSVLERKLLPCHARGSTTICHCTQATYVTFEQLFFIFSPQAAFMTQLTVTVTGREW